MAARDLHNKIKITSVHAKSLATAAALLDSTVIDRANFGALEFVCNKTAGTATTGTFIVTLQSGTASTASTHVAATTSEIIGSQTVTMTATTVAITKFGYIGSDRFASVSITAGAATGSIHVLAIQGTALKQPQS